MWENKKCQRPIKIVVQVEISLKLDKHTFNTLNNLNVAKRRIIV